MSDLLHAVETGNTRAVRYLLAAGVDVNEQDQEGPTALMEAARKGYVEIFDQLLSHQAIDVNRELRDGVTAIYLAVRWGYLKMVKSLVAKKANLNRQAQPDYKYTPLHEAAWRGRIAIVSVLVNAGAALDIPGKNGETPLHLAIYNSKHYVAIVKILIEKGADLNRQDRNGDTPLHYAVGKQCVEAIAVLIEGGANPNISNQEGDTPLHIAVCRQYVEIVKTLVEKGADPNQLNEEGSAPLHDAAKKWSSEIVEVLIKGGAEINKLNGVKDSPLFLAAKQTSVAVIKVLLNHEAQVGQREIVLLRDLLMGDVNVVTRTWLFAKRYDRQVTEVSVEGLYSTLYNQLEFKIQKKDIENNETQTKDCFTAGSENNKLSRC